MISEPKPTVIEKKAIPMPPPPIAKDLPKVPEAPPPVPGQMDVPIDDVSVNGEVPPADKETWAAIQTELKTRGMYPGEITGTDNAAVRKAILVFQQNTPGLINTGLADAQTLAALNVTPGGAPAPTLKDITPSTLAVGGEDTLCEIKGTGFTTDTVLVWNGTDDTATFVTPSKLETVVKASLVEAPATVPFYVRNGEVNSNELTFEFIEPEPRAKAASMKAAATATKK